MGKPEYLFVEYKGLAETFLVFLLPDYLQKQAEPVKKTVIKSPQMGW